VDHHFTDDHLQHHRQRQRHQQAEGAKQECEQELSRQSQSGQQLHLVVHHRWRDPRNFSMFWITT